MFVDADDPEWAVMWEALRERDGDTVARNPESGECWQYMGTWMPGDVAVHSFRHRDHPRTGQRESISIPCSPEFLARMRIEPELTTDEELPF